MIGLIKVGLFISQKYQGFLACYTFPAHPPAAADCEPSYENPFYRFDVTRIDTKLVFDQNNWDLGFFNSNRFNYYAWVDGVIDRNHIPIAVTWTGMVSVDKNEQVLVSYIGAGSIKIGKLITNLPASYKKVGQITLNPDVGI